MGYQRASQTKNNQTTPTGKTVQAKPTPLATHSPVHPLLKLQSIIGNQAVNRLIQTKMQVGEPDDVYEKEADSVAAQVMRMSAPSVQNSMEEEDIQTKPIALQLESDEEEIQTKPIALQLQSDEEDIQTKPIALQLQSDEEEIQTKANPGQTPQVSPHLETKIQSRQGTGQPLPDSTRAFMEPRFGADFSGVRVHTDSSAVQMNKELGAQAFTHGRDIFYGAGKSPGKNSLTAHELTHTIQQQPRPVAQKPLLNRTPEETPEPTSDAAETTTEPGIPTEPTSLAKATFNPSETVATYISAQRRRRATVPVQLGNLARGTLQVRQKPDGTYDTINPQRQAIPFTHPFLAPLQSVGIQPVLALRIRNNTISGYATIANGDSFIANPRQLVNTIKEQSETLGWLGMDISHFPNTQNQLENGVFNLGVENFRFKLGGFLDGTGNLGLANNSVTFNANATVSVRGLSESQINIERDDQGNLSGDVEVPVNFANFSGNVTANYLNGIVDIDGTVGYTTEKFNGEINLLVTDANTARNVALQQLGPEAVEAAAQEASGETDGRPQPGERALAGWGVLNFAFTEWMTGQAQVIIDNEGHITVVGEIAPPAEIELFPQKDYIKRLFTVEVRTLYGVPLVGNIFLFANLGMDAMAKLGPGKIYNIQVDGTYSTDPQVFNRFSIAATLNISAFAGLRLRGEGGAGVELAGHDIKAGAGINALAGVQGYVEATPTIGYREQADPEAGRQGEFYLNGHLELAAQPFLGLGGDLFVELDSPWWSPAPDKKWTWPLGQLEYPLPGEFGIGADVDYVIGSDQLPEIQFGEVDFNADRFMTDLMNDQVSSGNQGEQEQQGQWQENATTGANPEPTLTDSQGAPPPQPAQGQQQTGEGEVPAPNVQQRWLQGMEALGALARRSQSDPLNQAEIDAALANLRRQYGFTQLRAEQVGEDWRVYARMNPDNSNNPITVEGETSTVTGDENAEDIHGDTDQFGVSRSEIERRFRHRLDETYVFVLLPSRFWSVRRGPGRASGAGSSQEVSLVSRGNGSYSLEEVETSEEADARQAHEQAIQEIGADRAERYLRGHGDYVPGHAGPPTRARSTRDPLNEIGYHDGDHSDPNIEEPGVASGDWIPDHQPPDSLQRSGGAVLVFRFYPHSLQSANRQAGIVTNYQNKMKRIRQLGDGEWAKGVRSEWFW
ncbi:DUF4157 domain-containing protein [Moorena producens]|uniref:eCIS core domain-containing protein n=1 Tax=Moorena producens TaxID=1155739 RepID=UPI003C720A62